ncbi:MAG TPA: transposase [Nitrospiria bacterium]|nr:transposase [Nitrospiria bacterium]
MARKPRIEYPGALYHVIARGNQRRDVFHDDMDRLRYLARLRAYKERYGFRLYAYALMTNHVHLLLEPQQTGLSKIMQGLHQSYTQGYNRRYCAVGHVFQGRYQAILCDRDAYLLALVRYIHLNPVRARLVRDPADYPWSGHRAYLDSVGEGLVDTETVLGMLGERRSLAQKRYQAFVTEELTGGSRPEYYQVRDQRFLGDDAFVEQMQRTTAEERRQPVKTPSLAALLSAVVRATGVTRERITGPDRRGDAARARRLLVQAGAICAVPGRDLARLLGRDPAVISRLARMNTNERSAVTRLVAGKSTSQV